MASIFDKQILSEGDLARLEEIQDAWKAADDEKTKKQLHDKAEAIRLSYGYSGGGDGSEFILQNNNVLNTGVATSGYTDALRESQEATQALYDTKIAQVDRDAQDRLREAYIKNMQDSLGLEQQLRAAGVSGGASESTVAYMNSLYDASRNEIIDDAFDSKQALMEDAAKALSDSNAEIAKAEYDGASSRADRLTAAEQTAYDRNLDMYDRNYQKSVDDRNYEYQKSVDDRDYEYQKSVDDRDFEYQKLSDELDRQLALKKLSASSSSSGSSKSSKSSLSVSNVITLMKNGVYDERFASILGVSDDEVKAMVKEYSNGDLKENAWRLLDLGIFDDSFPELLGYSKDILESYAAMKMGGY